MHSGCLSYPIKHPIRKWLQSTNDLEVYMLKVIVIAAFTYIGFARIWSTLATPLLYMHWATFTSNECWRVGWMVLWPAKTSRQDTICDSRSNWLSVAKMIWHLCPMDTSHCTKPSGILSSCSMNVKSFGATGLNLCRYLFAARSYIHITCHFFYGRPTGYRCTLRAGHDSCSALEFPCCVR